MTKLIPRTTPMPPSESKPLQLLAGGEIPEPVLSVLRVVRPYCGPNRNIILDAAAALLPFVPPPAGWNGPMDSVLAPEGAVAHGDQAETHPGGVDVLGDPEGDPSPGVPDGNDQEGH